MQLLDTASVLPDFLLIFLALCFLLELAYFSELYAGRLGTGLPTSQPGLKQSYTEKGYCLP